MSIRLRLAVVFTLAAAIVFALASLLFVTELSSSLLGSIDAQLAAQLSGASRYLPAHGTPLAATGSPAPGEYVVQVIDSSGRVRGASPDAATTPMLAPAELRQARLHQIAFTATDEDERERLMAGPLIIRPARPGWIAVTGVDLEAFDSTISNVTRSLIIAGVVLVVASGLGAYLLARAALSPVERLRREVAALSEHDHAPGLRVPPTRDEIAALATTMNDLLSRLRRALSRQRALVADASHELRTPFAVLRGELELASQPGRSQPELAEAVSHATEEAARLARITDQLLFLARSDEDRMAPQLERTSMQQLMTRSADQAAARATAAGLTCAVDLPADLTANVDPDRIREAVDNLVDNALRFAPASTAIELSAHAVNSDLIIEVRDSGPGFPAGFLPHAFERFRRPDSARARADGGAGLGLSIVSAIAQAHGGRATAANRPAGGAVITIELPGAVGSGVARDQET
ncbi:MAG: ATP-binding protein [Actinomycetota bacterium]|nr:ATP-binding protein [Actinomycetota bacterium]